jgi:hypothetical protein
VASSRRSLAVKLGAWLGPQILRIKDVGKGWPSHVQVRTPAGWRDVALHVGTIGPSHRGRDSVERRFQNPGQGRPVLAPAGQIPVLLGISEDAQRPPVLVGLDARKRVGKGTRQSLFMPVRLLDAAAQKGWAEHFSDTGERLVAFTLMMLPVYVEMCRTGTSLPERDVQGLLHAAGADQPDASPTTAERGVQLTMRLVRDAAFSKRVRKVYDGRCAMCGLNFSLVAGAHIYPVSAPASTDDVWNGVALCHNHHAAFDAHQIWVEPHSFAIVLHPEMKKSSQVSAACEAFLNTTLPELRLPAHLAYRPRPDMFVNRYEYYDPKYSWADG